PATEPPATEPPATEPPATKPVPSLCEDPKAIDLEDHRMVLNQYEKLVLNDQYLLEYAGSTLTGTALFRVVDSADGSILTEFEAEKNRNYEIRMGEEVLLIFAVCSVNASIDFGERSVTLALDREVEPYTETPKEKVPPTEPPDEFLGSLPPLGNAGAPVVMIQFGDLQTPFEARFHVDTEPSIVEDFINLGRVAFYYRHFLLAFHELADEAAHTVRCANDQDAFWAMRSAMLRRLDEWTGLTEAGAVDHFVTVFARELELDEVALRECTAARSYTLEIEIDQEAGTALGVGGIPHFFFFLPIDRTDLDALTAAVGSTGTVIVRGDYYLVSMIGAQPFSVFRAVLDSVEYP
ncbi:MAG TPA: thioredoxin domain-containing protein, partial [Candidatus Bilamarchaeaceae archaeon]|nr:thioredoxin domain-containing protein [Candidatus Bilamarchaeaceae archaeon]